jgi:hypothetical protein
MEFAISEGQLWSALITPIPLHTRGARRKNRVSPLVSKAVFSWVEKKGRLTMWRRSWGKGGQIERLFEDLPPGALVSREMNETVVLDFDELQRAKWFWERRPGGLPCIQNALRVLLLCLAFYTVAIQIVADSFSGAILSALCATLVVTLAHLCRYARWKLEYRRAVLRLFPKGW